jgi:pilus assembly protein Flp/PilA
MITKDTSMCKVFAKILRLLASEDGPTAVEYAVMVALIVVACIAVIQNLGTSMSGTFSAVSSTVAPS